MERTLTESGKDEVRELAKSVSDLKLQFDVIATSPLKRSLETAQIIAKELKKQKKLEEWDELKPESDRKSLYSRLAKMKMDSSVMLVGHEPYLSTMISELISGKKDARIVLKKAGMAKLEITSFVPAASGELRWLLTPRLAKKVA